MGDLRCWSPESNGGLTEERPIPSSNPTPPSISAERWRIAEEATDRIICHVQPTVASEERRSGVIEYVQRLLRGYLGCEIFPFGSVPLKAYLPDGDIDLTAFGNPNAEDTLANDVFSVLEGEDRNNDAEFIVKDVKIINAEVKLVKCLVQNIVVDISFNQLGGLCTLCFLEQVDRLVGKDHLFKRSILLIKSWCYYESRILGAHHGLFSTYALETLVLYIFHLFHSSLNGPLAVLYRFLDYFCKFDWGDYCISIDGPVHISSLPEIVVERPDNGALDLLLSNEFLKDCVDKFSVPVRGHEMNSRAFALKHLNIVDPLKENNNLGRSISKGNSYRIRSAFTYGARKLGQILLRPEENISDELRKFFINTLDRNGGGQRPNVQDLFTILNFKGYNNNMGSDELFQDDKSISILTTGDSNGQLGERSIDSGELLQNGRAVDDMIPGTKIAVSLTANEHQKGSMEGISHRGFSEGDNFVIGNYYYGDAKDLATLVRNLRISSDTPTYSLPLGEESVSLLGETHHAPHLCSVEHAKFYNGYPDKTQAKISDNVNNAMFGQQQFPDENNQVRKEFLASVASTHSESILSPVARFSEDFYPGHWERGPSSTNGNPEALNTSSDLNADYEAHFHNLQYGRWCYEYFLSATIPSLPMPSQLLPQFQANMPLNSFQRAPQSRHVSFSHPNPNGIAPRLVVFPVNPPLSPSSAFGGEELPKARGTGTYFPNMNHQLNRVWRISPARGKNNRVPMRSPGHKSQAVTPLEANLCDGSIHEAHPSVPLGIGNFGFSEFNPHSRSLGWKEVSNCNGVLLPTEKVVEIGSSDHLRLGPSHVGGSWNPGTSVMANSSSLTPRSPGLERTKPVLATYDDRLVRSYHLKDEVDFPPLSS